MTLPKAPEWYMVEWTCEKWAECVAWYGGPLGLRPEWLDADRGFALFDACGGRIALKAGDAPTLGVIVSWKVADVEATVEELRRRGIDVDPIRDDPEGFREARFRDPEGRVLRVFAFPNPPGR